MSWMKIILFIVFNVLYWDVVLLSVLLLDDHSRITLAKRNSNYINANYIDVSIASKNKSSKQFVSK